MMATPQTSVTNHPAPARHAVPQGMMLFALTAAPLAWIFQTIANMAVTHYACFPKDLPLHAPAFAHASAVVAAIAVGATIVALVGLAVSVVVWKRTRRETEGDGHTLVEIGEGRTRFLAMSALVVSIGFCGAIGFAFAGLLIVPMC